jgi:hypothetical protein
MTMTVLEALVLRADLLILVFRADLVSLPLPLLPATLPHLVGITLQIPTESPGQGLSLLIDSDGG